MEPFAIELLIELFAIELNGTFCNGTFRIRME